MDEQEIKAVIDACPVCRKWQQPLQPKVRTGLPEKFNDLVDFDFIQSLIFDSDSNAMEVFSFFESVVITFELSANG